MATSSSGTSFISPSHDQPSSQGQDNSNTNDYIWTSSSGDSTVTALTSDASQAHHLSSLHPLDLGPPGYYATITLFEDTPYQRTVYLGSWRIVGSDPRRIIWQCNDHSERLEHFLPTDPSTDIHSHTLHARHQRTADPSELELHVCFREPHRVRYTTGEGVMMHDSMIEVKYDFSSVEGSILFQGDVRGKDLVDYWDIDVIWSDVHSRTDGFGNMRGMGLIQRMKLWRDRNSSWHSLSVLANRASDHQYREYEIHLFEAEPKNRDDRHRQLRLNVRGARRSGTSSEGGSSRRFSLSQRMRPRSRHGTHGGGSSYTPATSSEGYSYPPLDIRYLSIQFSRRDDYERFLENWAYAHSSDEELRNIGLQANQAEMSMPGLTNQMSGLAMPSSSHRGQRLQPIPEPGQQADSENDAP